MREVRGGPGRSGLSGARRPGAAKRTIQAFEGARCGDAQPQRAFCSTADGRPALAELGRDAKTFLRAAVSGQDDGS